MYKYFINYFEIIKDPISKYFMVPVKVYLGDTFVYFTLQSKLKCKLLDKLSDDEFMQRWIDKNFDNV